MNILRVNVLRLMKLKIVKNNNRAFLILIDMVNLIVINVKKNIIFKIKIKDVLKDLIYLFIVKLMY